MSKIDEQRSYYRDNNHLTRYGADYYLSDIFDRVFSEIKTQK